MMKVLLVNSYYADLSLENRNESSKPGGLLINSSHLIATQVIKIGS